MTTSRRVLVFLVALGVTIATVAALAFWIGDPGSARRVPPSDPSPEPTPDIETQELIVKAPGSAPLPANLKEILLQVSELRGLEPIKPIKVAALRPRAWKRFLQPTSATTRAIEREQSLLESLGLIPAGVDLAEIQKKTRPASTIGLYLPPSNKLFLRADPRIPSAIRDVVVAHEFVHALQDQTFHLERLSERLASVEEASAVLALIEGDATRIEQSWSRRYQSAKEQRIVRRLDEGSRRFAEIASRSAAASALDFYSFPYIHGLAFAEALNRRGGHELVDEAFESPPSTTESILHPGIFFNQQEGLQRPTTSPPSSGWRLRLGGDLGELEIRQLFAALGAQRSGAIAEGWNGGFVKLYRKAGQTATVISLLYDNRHDAVESCTAMPDWYSTISGGHSVTPQIMESSAGWMARACPDLQVDVAIGPDRRTVLDMVGGASKGDVPD